MITIFSHISNLIDSCGHAFIRWTISFKMLLILFYNYLFYISYIIVFTQQQKSNITDSYKVV
jgi:hypothetical protein